MAWAAAQARPPSPGLRRVTALLALVGAGEAKAGAWIAEDPLVIATAAPALAGPVLGEAEIYAETPRGEDAALVFTGSGRLVETPAATLDVRVGAGAAFKRRLAHGDGWTTAAQASLDWLDSPDARCAGFGAGGRLIGGASTRSRQFLNVEAGARIGQNGCQEGLIEAVVGAWPRPAWLAMAQLTAHARLGEERTLVAQLSAVNFSRWDRGLQLGLRYKSTQGRTPEVFLVVAAWRNPGAR